jgi:hypothetical protein
MSIKAMAERNNKPFQLDEVGSPIEDLQAIIEKGCRGDPSGFYHEGVMNPPEEFVPWCSDDIAMVEFNHHVWVHYLFRPALFTPDALDHIYRELFELTNTSVRIFWNMALHKRSDVTPPHIVMESTYIGHWKDQLKKLQSRDLGRYYGADNPWIHHPPDGHACLPGLPDDEVNLLLYVLWTGYRVEADV